MIGLALSVLLQAAAPAESVSLDRVVASLESEADPVPRFVLRSDFVLTLRVELVMRGAPDPLHVAVDPEYVSAPILEQLVAETLVVREAERAAMTDMSNDEVGDARAWLLAGLGGDAGVRALLDATGASQGEFEALVRRRAVATSFLRARAPRLIEPGASELRARWEDDRRRDPEHTPETFAAARDALVTRMVRAQYPRALRQYLRTLGGRVRVRYPEGAAP